MDNFYKRFCKTGFDENGVLNYFEPIVPEGFNFAYDVMDAIAAMEPDKVAMVWCNEHGEEKIITFAEMKEMTDRAANMFMDHGIQKGDMVMLVLKRHYQYWFSIYALHKIGAVAIPATSLLTKKDYVYRFAAANVKAVVCTGEGETTEHVEAAEKEHPSPIVKFIVRGKRDGWIDFDGEIMNASSHLERVHTELTDNMLMYFTSGTTGNPKMAVHDFSYPIGHIPTAKFWHNVSSHSLHISVADTGWAKCAWGKTYGQFICGAAQFVYDFDKFVPNDLLKMIERHKVTSFCAPPTVFRFFIKQGMENYDLSSLEYVTTAGEALNAEVFNRFKEYTGLNIMEGFGQTESTVMLANMVNSQSRPGSMGKPVPLYDIDLVDEDGNSVEPGVVGEIVVRTAGKKQIGLFKGYYNNPEKTQEAWHDGLYHTGDTAWKDEDGYFWYEGRTDDVIKASGYRIGPFEIESVLMEHPAVMECAVTGAPHPVRGQVVKATIILTKNYQPSDELVKELQDYVKRQTAPYKYPRIVEFVEELPKTVSGKIKRNDIRRADKKKFEDSL